MSRWLAPLVLIVGTVAMLRLPAGPSWPMTVVAVALFSAGWATIATDKKENDL